METQERFATVKIEIRKKNGPIEETSAEFPLSQSEFEALRENAVYLSSGPLGLPDFLIKVVRSFCVKWTSFSSMFRLFSVLTDEKVGGGLAEQYKEGEIALALLKFILRERGIRLGDSLKRDLGNIAKETKIPLGELKEFGKRRAAELVQDTFGK